MPAVLLPLRSNRGYLEISELRQGRISKADLNDPQSAREAIAEMGLIDRLRDWLFLDGAKEAALNALATVVIARHAGSTSSGPRRLDEFIECEEVQRAQEAFLDQLSLRGLRVVLADWRVCAGGYSFSPKIDRAVNDLLTFAMPAHIAGQVLKRAGMFDRAALSFNAAATSAELDGRLDDALAHFEEVADLWIGMGFDFRAQEARWHQAHLLRKIAMLAESNGANDRAAEAYESAANVWRQRFDFAEEDDAWRLAQDRWLDAAEAAAEAGDEAAEAWFLERRMNARTAGFVARGRAEAALRVEAENRKQRVLLGHV